LQAQYHSNELLREIKDQTARMALINGQINRAQYDQIKRLDNIAKNTANEAAHHKLHPGFGGAAGHVVPVRMVEHCAAEEKANVHRRKSADSGEKTAKHTQVTNDKLDRVIQRLESLAVALMHHDPKAQFNLLEELRAAGVHPALAHGH
ncbi:MAG: hypothetical protein ACRDFS_03510, partial [Chloroflexota bacterium]